MRGSAFKGKGAARISRGIGAYFAIFEEMNALMSPRVWIFWTSSLSMLVPTASSTARTISTIVSESRPRSSTDSEGILRVFEQIPLFGFEKALYDAYDYGAGEFGIAGFSELDRLFYGLGGTALQGFAQGGFVFRSKFL